MGGELVIGGVDKSRFIGDIVYTRVNPSRGYWEFTMDGLVVIK